MKRIVSVIFLIVLLMGLPSFASAQTSANLKLSQTKAELVLEKGDALPKQLSLTVKAQPDGAELRWSSSDETVVMVDENGLVTAAGFGKATITCTTGGESPKSASCVLTVRKAAVSRVKFGSSSYSISIAHGEALGKMLQLSPQISPKNAFEQNLLWESSDETVIKVDENGLVTSMGYGSAAVTATATDGSGKSAKCTVNVKKVEVSGVSFGKKAYNIVVGENGSLGEQLQLSASVSPKNALDGALVWASSDNEVAKVDENGLVTSVGFGSAVITAAAADGSGKSASCTVKVEYVEVKKISLNASKFTLEGGATYLLKAAVLPSDAVHKDVKWQSSAPNVASVDEKGIVTANGKGTAKIFAVATDGTQMTASCSVKVLSAAPVSENGAASDPIFSKNVYNLYAQLGEEQERVLRAYYATLGNDRGARIVKKALEYAGVSYAYVDCSKLTKFAYKAGGYTIPRISDDQAYALRNRVIDRADLRPGDLIFFKKLPEETCSCGTTCRRYMEIHHVGIYFGYVDGSHYIIDASSVIGKIVIRQWDGSDSFAEMLYAFSIHR